MKQRILGLDPGTNSLGWAVVDRDENNQYELIRYGDVIFTEGVKIEKGVESSKAAERSGYRALRIQYNRRRRRKIEVLRVLIAHKLCPPLTEEQLKAWQLDKVYPKDEAFMAWQSSGDKENPYNDRHRCLTERLDLSKEADRYTLGRAMYHLAQRRGFLSNRLDTTADEKETGKVHGGISDLTRDMEAAGCDYLGEYFYRLLASEGNNVRLRARYVGRKEHYEKEFDAICEKQQLDPALTTALRKAIFFQLPLKSQRHGVGKCTFEPRKHRCAESHPDFEEFRMLSFLNNVKIKTPADSELRPLNDEERKKASSRFYRKSKVVFTFEDIAKVLAPKKSYCHLKDKEQKDYVFNYRMTQSVKGSPVTAQLMDIFGEDWRAGIAETYTRTETALGDKTIDGMVDDVWNVLSTFDSEEKLEEYAKDRLQLDDEQAAKFAGIRLPSNFASLSLKAIRHILPFLRDKMIYSHAVLYAKIPDIVGHEQWERRGQEIIVDTYPAIINITREDKVTSEAIIKEYLSNNFDLAPGVLSKLYHPSMIEVYPEAQQNDQGVYQLGSPRTNAVRNPMAMRSLHILRKVINQLLKEGVIDKDTEVHVEYSRDLNDANMRKAIHDYQLEQNKMRQKYAEEIAQLFQEQFHQDYQPSERDILKYTLWKEQDGICPYTGKKIALSDFLSDDPLFDIEHTIPRSVGGDSTMMNLTLCDRSYNRQIKRTLIPSALPNHEEVLLRVEEWAKKAKDFSDQADKCYTHAGMDKETKDRRIQKRHLLKMKHDYWKGKYDRFTMTEVPENFSLRQGAGIGLIGKYAGMYLKTLFCDKNDARRHHVHVIKSPTTAEFRKMWKIQNEYEKKSRENHSHHCMDAITIACIGRAEYDKMARYYHGVEEGQWDNRFCPEFDKPWPTFTEDVIRINESLIVKHETKDNLRKQTRKRVRISGKGGDGSVRKVLATGDSARGILHKETYYGAIDRDGEIRYVVRKPLSSMTSEKDLDNIVDDAVREKIKAAVKGKNFKTAIAEPIYMNEEKGIRINKVRCYANFVKHPMDIRQQRDQSKHEYKRRYHVMNDSNYAIAIYEGEEKGKVKRDFAVVSNMDAISHRRQSKAEDALLFPSVGPKTGFPLRAVLRAGTHVLFFENSPEEIDFGNVKDLVGRLYKVVGMNVLNSRGLTYGKLLLRHVQEGRPAKDLKKLTQSQYKAVATFASQLDLYHSNFNALVEGVDFDINILGEITPRR